MSKRSYTKADKIHALKVYELCEGNLSAAARELGIPRMTLAKWVADGVDESELPDYSSVPDGVTLKQARFADEYVKSGNAKESARRAGYGGNDHTLEQIGHENLRKLEIRQRIQARLNSAAMLLPDEIRGTLTDQMRGDVSDFLNDAGYFSLNKAKENGVTHLLKKLEYDEFNSVKKFEIYSAQTAAIQLSRVEGIEQQPRENDADRRKRLTVKMLKNLIAHGASKEQAKADLLKLAVTEEDVNAALTQIEAHEPQPA